MDPDLFTHEVLQKFLDSEKIDGAACDDEAAAHSCNTGCLKLREYIEQHLFKPEFADIRNILWLHFDIRLSVPLGQLDIIFMQREVEEGMTVLALHFLRIFERCIESPRHIICNMAATDRQTAGEFQRMALIVADLGQMGADINTTPPSSTSDSLRTCW